MLGVSAPPTTIAQKPCQAAKVEAGLSVYTGKRYMTTNFKRAKKQADYPPDCVWIGRWRAR